MRGRAWTMGIRYPDDHLFLDEGALFCKEDWAWPEAHFGCNWLWLKYLGHEGD